MAMKFHVSLLAAVLMAWSCSIKEDRLPCPSYLTFDTSSFNGVSDTAFVNLLTRTQNLRDTLELEGIYSSVLWAARKGNMTAYAFANLKGNSEDDGVVTIAPGERADPLRAFCRNFDCRQEKYVVEAVPNRQTALIHLRISDVDGEYPYDLQIDSDVCGIDLKTMSPVGGRFFHDLVLDDELSCSFHLPRQNPESRPRINVFLDGVRIDSMPMYSWLESAGYDWTSDDLPDIMFDVDQAKLRVTVNVQGWDHEEYEIVL